MSIGILLTIVFFNSFSAQTDWTLAKEKNGIRIYTKEVEGSKFLAFRGVTEFSASLAEVWEILENVQAYPNWMYNTIQAKVIEKNGPQMISYVITDAPWPVSDRDGFYKNVFTYNPGTSGEITIKAIPEYGPTYESMVRIEMLDGSWVITNLGNDRVKVVYQAHSEPGGNIPGWLASSGVISFPYYTLENLKKLVKENRDQ